IGHVELDLEVVPAHHAAGLDQAAEADARSGGNVFLDDVARRIEEDNRILERAEHQRNRQAKDTKRGADQSEASLPARHHDSSCAAIAAGRLAFKTEPFDELLDPPQLVRLAGKRAPRIAGS